MPLINKDKATQYREEIVEKRAKSKRFGGVAEEKPKKKKREAPVEQQEEAPRSLKQNKALLLLGVIPIGIAAMFVVRSWPKNADEDQRHGTVCCRRMRVIHNIKEHAAEEHHLSNGEEIPDPVADEIARCRMNLCPAAGSITIGVIGDEPGCSIHGVPSDYKGPLGTSGAPP